jgi:DtxR family transcriptional regulator, Mn-dependent transcriptional regulator
MVGLTAHKENYLEIIYLLEKEHGHAHVKDIAEKIKIKMPSVTEAMGRLKEEGLVNYEKYGPVTLTLKGAKIAQNIFGRHQVLFDFLTKILDVEVGTAERDACGLEHVLSEETVQKIKKFMEVQND